MAYTKEALLERLDGVLDPELGLSVVALGLIYEASVDENGIAHIVMTLTSPACPMGPMLGTRVIEALKEDPAIRDVRLVFSFSPPWDPHTMATEEARWELGIFD